MNPDLFAWHYSEKVPENVVDCVVACVYSSIEVSHKCLDAKKVSAYDWWYQFLSL